MLWEMQQQTKIAGAERTAERAMMKADRYAADIAEMRRHMDRLSLACQAMWELLRDHTDFTEAHLDAKILEIDGRDGKVDGKIAMQQVTCPSCGSASHSKRASCVICGTLFDRQHKFEA